MSALLRAPLAVAAVAAVAVALAHAWLPLLGIAAGALLASSGVALCAASGDRSRRVLWGSVAAVTGIQAALIVLGPATGPDLATFDPIVSLRSALAAPLRALVPAPESGLLLGIVLGERGEIPREVRDAFNASGTAHLLAISGLHLTLVAGAVALVVRGRMGPRASVAVTLACVIAYALLVGPRPSVVRAALMAAAVAIALAAGRRGTAANGLGFPVALMLVADPATLVDVGFVLSASATAGLIALHAPIAGRLGTLPGPLRDSIAATFAATVPTLPVIAAVFGRVSLVAPLANVLAVPLLPPLMLLGAATSLVGAIWRDAAWPLAMGAFAVTNALLAVVQATADLPLSSVTVASGAASGIAAAALVAAGALAVGLMARADGRRAREIAALAVALAPRAAPAAVSIVAAAAIASPLVIARVDGSSPPLRIRALDVGQGDAFLIESRGRFALIDGGPDGPRLLARLGEALPPWHRRMDLVVLTHEHADHAAGLLAVLGRYEVGLAVEPAGMGDVAVTRTWRDHVARSGVPLRALAAGARVRLGDAVLEVLAPGRDRGGGLANIVIRVESGGLSVLFPGDATDDAIADLLLDPGLLRSRVYVPPHHGAASAHARALVEAVRPEAAVISVGASNRYGHPTPETLAALAGVPTYRTDRHGTVEIHLDGSRLSVRTAKTGVPPDRGGSVPRAPASR